MSPQPTGRIRGNTGARHDRRNGPACCGVWGLRSPARCSTPGQERINPKDSIANWMKVQGQVTEPTL